MACSPNNLLPGLVTLTASLALFPAFIGLLKRQPWRHEVREDVPASHAVKRGTPAMGGVLFVGLTLLVTLPCARFVPGELPMLCLTLLAFGLVGFVDDFAKVSGRKRGLRAREKLTFQFAASAALALWALTMVPSSADAVRVPFARFEIVVGWLTFPFATLLLVGVSNAANLNDGMDGLCAGLTLIALAALGALGWRAGRADLVVFAAALGGAVAGFLRYNAHPARVFMGDTGSLAIGGAVAMLAIMLRRELWLALIALPWVLDTLSVMIQVPCFKLTKRLTGTGRRVFPITPIHHAFEQAGWSEWRVCALFWAIGALGAALSLLA